MMSAPVVLHGGFEVGFRPDAESSIALSVDQARATDGVEHNAMVGTFRLRYGLKF